MSSTKNMQQHPHPRRPCGIFPALPCQRTVLICCFLLRTNFVPDEYFQALEPAFEVVYGRGVLTWEWSKAFCLRSYVGLLPFIGVYKLLQSAGMDSAGALYAAPRALQCLATILADVSLYKIAR